MKFTKEISLICCVIRENELINQTLFESFDLIFEIALAFEIAYGVDTTKWGVNMEYEETIIEFTKSYLNKQL